ncbi:hypothetical protein HK105_207212 [Polyrhizophydium stewartii]|uniref:Uncharacterized protein n=1 Tax=Polyrhizophydium stewartii TaxID=2732419 RepID=A0ABR4N1E6_9FUNG
MDGWESVRPSRQQAAKASPPTSPQSAASPRASAAARNMSRFAALSEMPVPDSAMGIKARAPDAAVPASPALPVARPAAATPPGIIAVRNLDADRIAAAIATLRKQTQPQPVMDLCETLEIMIAKDTKACVAPFSSKAFKLEFYRPGATAAETLWRGPMPFASEKVVQVLLKFVLVLDGATIRRGLIELATALVEEQRRAAMAGTAAMSRTIGHQLLMQVIAMAHPGSFYAAGAGPGEASAADIVFGANAGVVNGNPAVGHTLLWICAQQTIGTTSGVRLPFPKGLEYWFKFMLPAFGDGGETSVLSRVSAVGVKLASVPGEDSRTAAAAAVATTVQDNALVFAEQTVESLDAVVRQSMATAGDLPLVRAEWVVSLIEAAFSRHTAVAKRRRGAEFVVRLHTLWVRIRSQMHRPGQQAIRIDEPGRLFTALLGKLTPRTDESVREEIQDVLVTALETTPSLLGLWTQVYGDYVAESLVLAAAHRLGSVARAGAAALADSPLLARALELAPRQYASAAASAAADAARTLRRLADGDRAGDEWRRIWRSAADAAAGMRKRAADALASLAVLLA